MSVCAKLARFRFHTSVAKIVRTASRVVCNRVVRRDVTVYASGLGQFSRIMTNKVRSPKLSSASAWMGALFVILSHGSVVRHGL